MFEKRIKKMLVAILGISILSSSIISAYAHEALLDVDYDDCVVDLERGTPVDDGKDEIWYYLYSSEVANHVNHLDDKTQTIRYYFADSAKDDDTYKWTTDIKEILGITQEKAEQAEK